MYLRDNDVFFVPIFVIGLLVVIFGSLAVANNFSDIIQWCIILIKMLTFLNVMFYTAIGFLVTVYLRYKVWKHPFRLWIALLVLLLWPLWVVVMVAGFLHYKKI